MRPPALATRALALLLLVGGSIVFLIPFLASLSMALKSPGELATTSPWQAPIQPTTDNFRTVLTNENISFLTMFKNVLLIASLSTVGVVFSSSMVAYAFARMKFVARDKLFLLVLSTMMLPGVVTMIPTYVLYKELHWVNTFLPLTVPAFLGGGAFNIFLLRQFMMGIPRDLDEAAKIDGAGHWTVYWRVLLPLCGPALATVGLFTFIGAWRDFMGPLLYLNDPAKQTLELGLNTYNSMQTTSPWHLIMAASVLVTLPLMVIFFIGQRFFIKGIAMTGIK
ncbi:MAG: carbohydrate ABC transporter permease [Armatimonadetes bacterium]|nr:carbohydrate ABC transporter permease [Armatimonadota bacterium]